MSYSIIGLDRGTSAIKAVLLEKSFRGYEVKGVRMIPVPQDGSSPPSEEAIQAAVSTLVAEFDPEAVGYVVAASGSDVSTWMLQLPFTDQRRIEQTLPFELENYVSFDLDDMILDYEVVRTVGEKSRVAAALIPKSRMTTVLRSLNTLKIDPQAMVLDSYALTYVPPVKEGGERPVAIIDMGHTQTLVTVRLGQTPDFLRTLQVGGLQVTQALMDAFQVSFHTAEQMKARLGPVAFSEADLALHAAVDGVPLSAAALHDAQVAAIATTREEDAAAIQALETEGQPGEASRSTETPQQPLEWDLLPEAPETTALSAPVQSEFDAHVPTPARSFDDSGDWGAAIVASLESDATDPYGQRAARARDAARREGRAIPNSFEPDGAVPGTLNTQRMDTPDRELRRTDPLHLTLPELTVPSRQEPSGDDSLRGATIHETVPTPTLEETQASYPVEASENAGVFVSRALPTPEAVQAVVWEAMDGIFREIRNTLMAYEAGENKDIGAVLLVGGGALMPEVCERMTEYLGVSVGMPFKLGPEQIQLSGLGASSDAGSKTAPGVISGTDTTSQVRFALPFALSYLGAAEGKYGVLNFRHGEFAYRRNYEAVRGYFVAAIVLLALGLMALSGFFVNRVIELNAEGKALDAKIASAIQEAFPDLKLDLTKGTDKALALILEEQLKLEDRGKILGLGDAHKHALDVLKEISTIVPAREELTLDVDEFQLEGDQLKMRGTTGSFDDVEKIEKAIQGSSFVKEIKNDVQSKDGKKFFNFTITLKGAEDENPS